MVQITLEIRDDLYEFARGQRHECEFSAPEEYLLALLNMAVLMEMDERNALPHAAPFPLLITMPEGYRVMEKMQRERKPDFFDELEEDEGGGVRLKRDADASDDGGSSGRNDLDDGIPF